MPLFSRQYSELMADSIEELSNNTNFTRLSAGGKARSILETVNRRVEETYDNFSIDLARAFVSSAPGQFLDLFGELLGVPREQPASASADADMQVFKWYVEGGATFGSINNNADIPLPRNITLSTEANSRGVTYRLKDGAVLSSSSTEAYSSAEATIPGSDSNIGSGDIRFHDFTNYTDSNNSSLLVTNIYPIANGKDFESDANYRYRIVNRVLEGEAANVTAIRLAALSVPGVADVIIRRRYRGVGTFAVIIQAVTPTVSTNLVDSVKAKVESVMAIGEVSYVMGPKETGVTLHFIVSYEENIESDVLTEIESQMSDIIVEYINSLDIGSSFSVDRLIADLYTVDKRIVIVGEYGKPVDNMYIYRESKLGDNRVRQTLLGSYSPEDDERVIVEPSVTESITFQRKFVTR